VKGSLLLCSNTFCRFVPLAQGAPPSLSQPVFGGEFSATASFFPDRPHPFRSPIDRPLCDGRVPFGRDDGALSSPRLLVFPGRRTLPSQEGK